MHKSTVKVGRGVGDHPELWDHETQSIRIDSEGEAQKLADLACKAMGWKKFRVTFTGENMLRLNGRVRGDDMTIHRKGETAACILHELAHTEGRMHNSEFQEAQMRVVTWFDENQEELEKKTPMAETVMESTFEDEDPEDLLELVLDEALGAAQAGRLGTAYIWTRLIHYGIKETQNFRLLTEMLKEEGIMVVTA